MRKLKQILAGFLAMNLTISAASTGMINVSASEEYSGEGVYDEMYAEEGVQTYAEEAAAPEEVVSETEPAYYSSSSDIAMEAEVPEAPLETESSTPVPETPATTASVETSESTIAQVPQESTSESVSNPAPEESVMPSSESQESSSAEQSTEEKSEEEASSEEASSEEESTEEEMAVFTARSTVNGQLKLSQFKKYDKDNNSIEITSGKQLILLSNCDPRELQDITIELNMTGNIDLTEDQNVKSGENISDWITNLSTTDTVSDSEEQQTDEQSEVVVSDNEEQQVDEQSEVVVQEESVTAEQEYSFQGIGSVDYPFRGKIIGKNIPWYTDRTFFGGLSSKAQLYSGTDKLQLQWYGNGTMPMLAEVYRMGADSSEDGSANSQPAVYTLNVSVSKGEKATAMGSLIGMVTAANGCENDTLQIGNVVIYGDATVKVEPRTGNAGLICNTLESGKISLNGYTFPTTNYTVNSTAAYNTVDTSAAGNVGGVIGVMKTGTSLSIESEATVENGATLSSTGNVGGLVGLMEDGATIAVSDNVSVTLKNLQLTAGVSAGGLVGLMKKGAKITTGNSAAVTLSSPSITGTVSAGGVVGTAEDVVFADDDMQPAITVSSPTVTGNGANGATVGGFIGSYTLNATNLTSDDVNADTEPSLSLPNQITIGTPTLTVNNNGVAGGYFGYLNLNGNLTYTIGNANSADGTTNKVIISPTYTADCSAEAIGAIAGKVTSDTIASTLLIQNVQATVTNSSGTEIQYHGGLIGEIGQTVENDTKQYLPVYLKVDTVNISVNNPKAKDEEKKGFGGITGLLAQGSIVQTNNITMTTSDTINRGGGLVGYAEKSVINVSGMTNLSGVIYDKDSGKNAKTGWLVGWQESALIYANGDGNGNGWSYIRGKESGVTKQAMNDIGNYGQIIRLHSSGNSETEKSNLSSNLITIDATEHTVSYAEGTAPEVNGDTITLGSVDAFARLSICWNTRGYFGGITEITSKNFNTNSPRSKNITLSENIDLTGSGIGGLSRDTYVGEGSDDDTYTGSFDGGSHTITLSIGETFGIEDVTTNGLVQNGEDGYGEVISAGAYYHGRQGLFAKISNATIKNLTIDGAINISNAGKDILAGGIAGEIAGKNSKSQICGVIVKENINADCASDQILVVGGFFGGSYNDNIEVTFSKSESIRNVAESEIKVNSSNSTVDKYINIGEIIGEVGESAVTFEIKDFIIKGSITTDAKSRAYVGGLIGVIKGDGEDSRVANHTINIKNVEFNEFKIEASEAADVSGGLFGSIWLTAAVSISGDVADNSMGLIVTNATINAPKATNVGGLAYRSSGKWEVQGNGISLGTLNINAGKNLGLLVCKGEKNTTEQVGSRDRTVGALYLYTTNWANSYRINKDTVSIRVSDEKGVFDEFVAYTTSAPNAIFDNNKNGVISIATEDTTVDGVASRVGVDPENECTTYQNRTSYGEKHQTNAYSRYYYDLDQCLEDMKNSNKKNNKKLDTPQELLLWSVYNYACQNIKSYFAAGGDDITKTETNMPWAIGGIEELDMSTYSYYPIKIEDVNVNVTETELKFNNEHIQTIETQASNKSTQGTNDSHTQHYAMHCGLFLNSQRNTLTVRRVTFSGSIGKVNNNTSGVLVSNFAAGNLEGSNPKRMNINITDITLNGLKVTGCGNDYAPLLINNIADNSSSSYTYGYTKLDVNGVYVKGYEGNTTAVASSLIGSVGSSKAKEITLSFQNIALPDKKASDTNKGCIFSHATLLEHFAYANDDNASGASYIFYKKDDWKEDGTWDHHKVTYGKEITKTVEFPNLQLWYYDESTYKTDDGLVYTDSNNKKGFDSSSYLPYVSSGYSQADCKHEIKVNQRVVDITSGCGTYGHPYKITKESEMNILSSYMATGQPSKDWRVTITSNQNTVHTDGTANGNDITYQYDGNNTWKEVKNTATGTDTDAKWEEVSGGKTLPKDFMRYYLLNAYYDIQGTVVQGSDATSTTEATAATDTVSDENTSSALPTLILTDFAGFGINTFPFRGVITSTNNTTIILKGKKTGNGLIPYSYGSVVKNLNIVYEDTKILTYEDTTKTSFYPQICFGGVIGCVLGGDNIIDNVKVTIPENYLTLSGTKSHLIQVGGYVGSVSGGGVIFRDMTDETGLKVDTVKNSATTNTDTATSSDLHKNLYINPYVGRVLDGFAFYEKVNNNAVDSLQNTNKNYQINTLASSETSNISMNGNTVTVNDAQGLLILSAIVNSGAASNGISNAYSKMGNSDGKAYTASAQNYSFGGLYGKVRNALYSGIGTSCKDATLSITEDQNLPGEKNLPYLIRKYCGNVAGVFSISTNSNVEIVLSNAATAKFDMTAYGNGYQGIGARYVSNAVRGHVDGNVLNHPEGVIPELKSFNGNGKTVTMSMQVSEYANDDFHAASVGGIFNVLRVYSNADQKITETISNVAIGPSIAQTSTEQERTEQTQTQETEQATTPPTISLNYYNSNGEKAEASSTWASKVDVGVGGLAGSLVGYTGENANRDITVANVQVNNLSITSPASAGGIFGNTGKPRNYTGNLSNGNDIAVLLQPKESQIAYGIAFNKCSYTELRITGKYAAGGFVGYIGNKEQNPRSSVDGFQTNTTTADADASESTNTTIKNTGENSTITATDNSSWAGGLFGYVKTRLFINMTDGGVKNDKSTVTLQNVAVSAGTAVGGCVGYIDEKCYGIHNVTVKGTSSSKVTISLNSSIPGTFYVGGIVGYVKGTTQNWTQNWRYAGGISNSSIEYVQINNADIAKNHDYTGTNKIQTNYIAGGITGQVAGGKTRMESCTVTLSDIYGSVASGITGQTDSQMEFVNCEVKGTSEDSKTNIKGFSTAGGILGFWTGGQIVNIQGCKIQYMQAEGKDWGSGAIIGDADGGVVGILYLFDTSAQDSTVTAAGNQDSGGGRWPCVGSIIGNLRNSIKASNVLISNVILSASDGINNSKEKHGLLFGNANNNIINIAGISIQEIPDSNNSWSLAGGNNNSNNSYIAFADYSGTAIPSTTTTDSQATDTQENSKTSLVGNSNDLLGSDYKTKTKDEQKKMTQTDVASPYVVTSPKSALALYDNANDLSPKYLYGDGVAWTSQTISGSGSSSSSSTGESSSSDSSSASVEDTSDSSTAEGGESSGSSSTGSTSGTTTSFTVMAKQIWDNRKNVAQGHYAYKGISSTLTFDFTSLIATYNANQTNKVASDFPVIQLTNGNADVVTSYLDILTNGAFSAANTMNKKDDVHVTARVDVYSYDSVNKKFIKAVDKNDKAVTPAFQVNTDGSTGNISFVTTSDYDNDRNRFNLLTVTFTEKDANDTEHHYNVFVPILVRRMLEMDFTATLTYGTDFNKENYSSLTNHVLESFGSSVTGYLTYTYNSDASTYTDYGWQSYINAGGNVMEMKKFIKFTMTTKLPEGTQLSLVDQESGRVYYYTATGDEKLENGGYAIPLASFMDSDGNAYQEPSISELIGATASETGTKLFVKVDETGKRIDSSEDAETGKKYPTPTVKIKTNSGYEYYRLATSDENATHSIIVDEEKLHKEKSEAGSSTKKIISTVTENYYLVITVPENAQSPALNGSIQTTVDSEIPHLIHYLKRDDGKVDAHGNTASTYQLSNGYQQELTETSFDGASKKITTADSKMTLHVTDKITFPNSQSYNSSDQLYLRFVGGLQKTVKDSTGTQTTSSEQFPKGTAGEVSFSVYTMKGDVKTYYVYTDSSGWALATGSETNAVSYDWTSRGGEMELPLATAQPTAQETTGFISLQGLRDLIKTGNNSEDTTFYVEVKLEATLPTSGLDVIPETKLGTDSQPPEYTKLTCFAQLSTVSQSLTYSSNRASISNMTTLYYRDEPAGVKLTYDADLIDQLGVNLLDLRYLDATKEHSLIDTTAIYDLSAMKNLESTLKDSTGIKFTLTLCQKNTSNPEDYNNLLSNANQYLAVELKSSNSGEIKYNNSGTWSWTVPKETYYNSTESKLEDNTIFSNGRLTQLIQLKVNVNVTDILYSNYKVILTAEILDKNGTVSDSHKDDNIIYTFAKINPEFVEQNN